MKHRYAISRSPRKFRPQAVVKRTGGIRNRRIGDPEDVSSTHYDLEKSEIPIGERTVVLWTNRSHAKGVSQRELRGAESTIADWEPGIHEVSGSRPCKGRFLRRGYF
jgi:hypothetical protein